MTAQSIIAQLGDPAKRVATPDGELNLFIDAPFFGTIVKGYAAKHVAIEIDSFYRLHYPLVNQIITIHHWGELTDYDAECRKILQNLTHAMREKQKEILIYLGPAQSLGQKVIRATAETITRFRGMPIEIYSDETAFSNRVDAVMSKYRVPLRQFG